MILLPSYSVAAPHLFQTEIVDQTVYKNRKETEEEEILLYSTLLSALREGTDSARAV